MQSVTARSVEGADEPHHVHVGVFLCYEFHLKMFNIQLGEHCANEFTTIKRQLLEQTLKKFQSGMRSIESVDESHYIDVVIPL